MFLTFSVKTNLTMLIVVIYLTIHYKVKFKVKDTMYEHFAFEIPYVVTKECYF